MSGPGYVFKDSGTTPPALDPTAIKYDQHHQRKDNGWALVAETSEIQRKQFNASSHELAHEVTTAAGTSAVQKHPTGGSQSGTRNIGWHKPVDSIPDPLVFDIPNGRLWSLIRRFNKDVFHVQSVPPEAAHGLDLNEAWAEDHTGDKMTLHLERAYFIIVLNVASLLKHTSRLRSWKETRRTTAFCVAYSVAWYFDWLVPLLLGTLIVIIASQAIREALFPPAPLALVGTATGGIQTPAAGRLGTTGTLTGAPEKQQGEAAEEEAASFVANFRHLLLKIVGAPDGEDEEGSPLKEKVPKPIRDFVSNVKAEGAAPRQSTPGEKQTQGPMEDVIWAAAKPENLVPKMKAAPHIVGEIIDDLERLANALSPTPPFSQFSYLRIITLILPLFLVSLFADYYMVYKGIGSGIGFAIFGRPIIKLIRQWLNHAIPRWTVLLNSKYNMLRGVPTNRQLTITLLRVGEVHDTPLPPVPSSKPEDDDQPANVDIDDVPVGTSRAEVVEAISATTDESREENQSKTQHPHISRLVRMFKRTTAAAVDAKLGVEHVRMKAGSEKIKDRVGAFVEPEHLVYAEPDAFRARFEGKSGWVYIIEGVAPLLLFSAQDPSPRGRPDEMHSIFEIPIGDITMLKRATAFVTAPTEKAVQWSSDKEVLASLDFEERSGKSWRLTAVPERDELFNRLVAIGGQHWENL